MKICGIYKITSPTNSVYIGQSINVNGRYRYYKALLCKAQPRLYNSIIKHGWANHKFEVIHECAQEQLNFMEQVFIEKFNTCNSEHGLNLTKGGIGRGIVSDETRIKSSKALKGKPAWNKGIPHSDEVRNNISIAMRSSEKAKALYINPEWRKKVGNSLRGKNHTSETKKNLSEKLKGRTFSQETKDKMSIGSTGILHTQETKTKIKLSTTGKLNHFYGKKHSKETIQKIKDSILARKKLLNT